MLRNAVFVLEGMCLTENQRFLHYVKRIEAEENLFSVHICVIKNSNLKLIGTIMELTS
jgi:hypothetical protein